MYRFLETLFFSMFFVFVFIKYTTSLFLPVSDQLTYIYYLILLFFISVKFFKTQKINVNTIEVALWVTFAWHLTIALSGAQINEQFLSKLSTLILTLMAIPIAHHIAQNKLVTPLMVVTSAVIVVIATLFKIYGTFDSAALAYNLNNFYLHGAFLSGLIITMAIGLRKNYFLIPPLLICILVFAARGPFLALIITLTLVALPHAVALVSHWRFKSHKVVTFFLLALTILIPSLVLWLPDVAFRMQRRWSVVFSEAGGGDSLSRRFEHYQASQEVILDHPLFGIGFANYGEALTGSQSNSYPHNLIIELVVESGIIGAIPFLLGLSYALLLAFKTSFWSSLLFVLIVMQFSYSYAELNELYFTIVLTLIAVQQRRRRSGAENA